MPLGGALLHCGMKMGRLRTKPERGSIRVGAVDRYVDYDYDNEHGYGSVRNTRLRLGLRLRLGETDAGCRLI